MALLCDKGSASRRCRQLLVEDSRRRWNTQSLLQTKDQLLLLQAACSLPPILLHRRATSLLSSSSSSPPAVGIWCRTKRHMGWWVVYMGWHRHGHMVVLLADVLHNVLALTCERCLSHYSGEEEVAIGKPEIKYL